MYIEDLDEATTLRNRHRRYGELREAALTGAMGNFTIWLQGSKCEVFSIICADPIRKAIVAECDRMLSETERKMGAIGVNPAPKLVMRPELTTGEREP